MRALALLTALSLLVTASPAKADYSIWADSETGISLSYPDTWRQQVNFQADDLVTLAAPTRGDDAQCKVKAREERRYMVYPVSLSNAVQREAVSKRFWQEYLASYNNVTVAFIEDGAGFGRGYGSILSASFTMSYPQTGKPRSGIAAATLYRDHVYILECTSDPEAFGYWQPIFLSVLKSVDMPKRVHELRQSDYGDYRDMDFLFADPTRHFYFSQ
jgi:hypothetical protein